MPRGHLLPDNAADSPEPLSIDSTLAGRAFQTVTIHGQRPSPRYRFVPFLMLEPRWTLAELAWKTLNRLPYPIKDRLARALSGYPFYPAENDWLFEPERFDGAHALLAVAR